MCRCFVTVATVVDGYLYFLLCAKILREFIFILFPLKNYVVLNFCHTAFDAGTSEIKRDTASSVV